MSSSALVKDYMTRNVITVTPETPNDKVIELMKRTGHDGFPVKSNGEVIGIVTAFDLLLKEWVPEVRGIMSTDVVVADHEMPINDASRVMFRMGISRLPVVDKQGKLVGILTNTDIVRSHIERSTPMKVKNFKKTLEDLYNIKTRIVRMKVPIKELRPTQDRIYADELQGRTYELKRGLAEPTIVVKVGKRFVLVDGHHRTVAARKLGYNEIDAYVIQINEDMKLGLEKTADKDGIFSFEDIKIIDDAQHPLIALTESMKKELSLKKEVKK